MRPSFRYKIVWINELSLPGFFLLAGLLLLNPGLGLAQCSNPPTVTLSSTKGSTCRTTPVTVGGNTFAGGATYVTLKDNGDGSVSPTTINSSPFTFTYTPKSKDVGKTVTITVTTNDPWGSSCKEAITTYSLTVSDNPSTPHIGTITMPTCALATGSVALSSLPSGGTWTITRSPGGVTTTGTGTSTTISGIPAGTYTFTVANSGGCSSSASSGVVISAQPLPPQNPAQTIDCALGSGKAVIRVTGPVGTGLEYRLDGGAFQSGTSFSNVANGNHSITVRNSSGCTNTGVSFPVACSCANQPVIGLSSASGITCGIIPVTKSGNTFGGSATSVTITENGAGTVSPVSATTSPFAFTYTPAAGDAGNIVTITVTTSNPLGLPCAAATATCVLMVNANPSAPVVGAITQPTCSVGTGSVVLSGLPASGTWTLTRNPGATTTTGTGTSTTISGVPTGTNTFTVTNANNCISSSSSNVVLVSQASAPAVPVVGSITLPTCIVSTGSVLLTGLPSAGNWTLTRYPGMIITDGTGTTATISGLAVGIYNYTVTNSTGCVSGLTANVTIPQSTGTPTPPLIGSITQPGGELMTGSVVLNGLPETGSWTLVLTPGNISTSGTGISKTISGLAAGTYNFTVTNAAGCISGLSASAVIGAHPSAIKVVINNPAPVCFPSTVDITAPEVTSGSATDLTYTYWSDPAAKIPYVTPLTATAGTYYIKCTTQAGLFTIKPVLVTLYRRPLANAGADQVMDYKFGTKMNTELSHTYETGVWSVISGTGLFFDASYTKTAVDGLSIGENKFLWTVTNGVCPPSLDTVIITVHDLVISTLITPNRDGRNDYFVLNGISIPGRTELVIFDRSGVQVYKNENYDNLWDGVDYKGNPVPDDTYFCIIKTGNRRIVSGYIVVRR